MRYLFVHIGPVVLSAFVQAAAPTAVPAQTTVAVGQMTARQHLESAAPPMYPIIAQAAKVTGVVTIDVTIAPDGRVVRAFALGGPPMLVNAAETGVRAWRFRPITPASGEAVTARTVISVLYGPQPAQPAIEAVVAYGDAMLLCVVGVDTQLFDAALPHCAKSIALEATLTPALRQGPRAGIIYGIALAGAGQHDEALNVLSNTERAYPKLGWSPIDEALGHLVRARADLGRGKLQDAAERYEDAYNNFDQTRRRIPRDSPLRGYAIEHQRQIGPEWADVLDQLNRQRDAERVRARVQSLE